MKLLAVIVEVVGVSIVSVGIGIEIIAGAEIGFTVITGGSLVIAAGSLIYAKLIR